jgi:hypothetical protein
MTLMVCSEMLQETIICSINTTLRVIYGAICLGVMQFLFLMTFYIGKSSQSLLMNYLER